ncbi:MerR family transcriptional regulator [Streptomyces zagrosensis]|uniref:DNA-binding transcriptional MerR regulator n=1 Tax=Streptomyces zagrosensis TaxID=1042984 RepID=A0A7W9Q3X2_9ACTN|nr:MerR family transcriptional regulator [Streptomyces zagrosensis]MBB5933139.1 DNA-binding transcriptional MerR regulator [Streptomyces zagrosensis]
MSKEIGMRIGELAGLTGVSPRSLRYYEQQGLLAPQRADNGYRAYDRLDAVRVANIKVALDAGLTLEDVRPVLGRGCLDVPLRQAPYSDEWLILATDRLAMLDDQIAALQGLRRRLVKHIDETVATRPVVEGED